MCGIIGIISKEKRDIVNDLANSLARLEYRGYDSAGIAFIYNNEVKVYKCLGAPSLGLRAIDIESQLQDNNPQIKIGIGHNRWATHGGATLLNAHPHTDTDKNIFVVHNGTILNYDKLKSELQQNGVTFQSETDTEIIPQMIAYYIKEGLEMKEAFIKTINRLEEGFGIVAFNKNDENTIYTAKQGSPILIGIGEGEYFISSSIHGFITNTNKYVSLNDGEMAIININHNSPLEIFTYKEKININKNIEIADNIDEKDLSKGDYETFMLKEIYEQSATFKATLLGRLRKDIGEAIFGGLIEYKDYFINIKNILWTGCGTAYNATTLGAHLIEKYTNIICKNEIASEGRFKKLNFNKNESVVFAVSQSGETADTLEYIKDLKQRGYKIFGIINVIGSAIAKEAGAGIYTRAGSEIGVASTKAFTTQLAIIYGLVLFIARKRDMSQIVGREFVKELELIPELMKSILEKNIEIENISKQFINIKKVQFLGRGMHNSIANESALKFKELTYIEAGAYPLGELKHGPIAVIDEETVCVIIMPKDELIDENINSVEQIKSKNGKVFIITSENMKGNYILDKADAVFYIPNLENEDFYPIIEIIPIQLFAYYFAKLLGRNIDKPRNLAKSVTVK